MWGCHTWSPIVSEPECPICSLSPCVDLGWVAWSPALSISSSSPFIMQLMLSPLPTFEAGKRESTRGWRCKLCYSGKGSDLRHSRGAILSYGSLEPEGWSRQSITRILLLHSNVGYPLGHNALLCFPWSSWLPIELDSRCSISPMTNTMEHFNSIIHNWGDASQCTLLNQPQRWTE